MGQIRYQNFGRPLVSFDENRRTIGLAIPGVYCGWDKVSSIAGNSVTIAHDQTGVLASKQDNSTLDGPLGLAVSKHGVEIYEDAPVIVNVSNNIGNAFIRVDWLVMSHNYLGTGGGTPASYSIVQGPNGANFAEPSALPNPATQIIIGKFYIPASATDLSGIAYIKAEVPKLGGFGFTKLNEFEIKSWANGEAVLDNLNLLVKTGAYSTFSTTSNSPIASRLFSVIVLRKGNNVTQLASDQGNGKVYSRNTTNLGASWGPWQNLNNADVVVDFSPINAKIGSQTYTAQNFVTNGQSLTASIDALDIEAEVQLNALSTTNTNVTNLATAIGSRNYTQQNVIDNGESITASLDKLDIHFGFYPLYKKLINIGDWDMDSTPTVNIAHGLTPSKIRSVTAFIRCDVGGPNGVLNLIYASGSTAGSGGQPSWSESGSTIDLSRYATGIFDNADYDSTGYNRGWIIIEYTP